MSDCGRRTDGLIQVKGKGGGQKFGMGAKRQGDWGDGSPSAGSSGDYDSLTKSKKSATMMPLPTLLLFLELFFDFLE